MGHAESGDSWTFIDVSVIKFSAQTTFLIGFLSGNKHDRYPQKGSFYGRTGKSVVHLT
jgi:hypothetical protein